MSYAGDVSCEECWEVLSGSDRAYLVDVRTVAEWNFVGVPVLQSIGKQTMTIEWQKYPTMEVNADFVASVAGAIEANGDDKAVHIYCICRSGARSIAAAEALTAAGYQNAFNVLEGFEGDKDGEGHRGQVGGWKFAGLPWAQG